MNKYLPNPHELRQAIFSSLVLLIILIVLGFLSHVLRFAFGENYFYKNFDRMGGMHTRDMDHMMGDDMSGANMDEMMMNMSGSLEGLKGSDLEQMFLEQMIVHHQGAVDMAETLKAGTKRPELLKMANDIITTQTKEISQMENWLNTWFGATTQSGK